MFYVAIERTKTSQKLHIQNLKNEKSRGLGLLSSNINTMIQGQKYLYSR
jgi:hypothetical protein